jgi:hypothetical protein
MAFPAFDTLMAIEAASAATLGGFHRLPIHDHDTGASFATGRDPLSIVGSSVQPSPPGGPIGS